VGPYELSAASASFATITVPDWTAAILVVAFVVYLVLVKSATVAIVEATAAVEAAQRKRDPAAEIARLEKIAIQTDRWLKLTERASGAKAALFGVTGVLLGVIGGLAGSWVADGTWGSDNTTRALKVVVGLAIISAVGFGLIYLWKPKKRPEGQSEKTAGSVAGSPGKGGTGS